METYKFEELPTPAKINAISNLRKKLIPETFGKSIFTEWGKKIIDLGFINPFLTLLPLKSNYYECYFTFDGINTDIPKCLEWLLSGTNQYKKIIESNFEYIHANAIKPIEENGTPIIAFKMKWKNNDLSLDDAIQSLIEDKIETNITIFVNGISEKISSELNSNLEQYINSEKINNYIKSNPQLIFNSLGEEINLGMMKYSKLIGKNFKIQARDTDNLPIKSLLTFSDIFLSIPEKNIYTVEFISSPLIDIDSFELNENQLNQLLNKQSIEFIEFDFQNLKGTLTPLFL